MPVLTRAWQAELHQDIVSLQAYNVRRETECAVWICRTIISAVGRSVYIIELQEYRSLEANSWDVIPVEQSVGSDRRAEEEKCSEDDEEGG